MTKKLAQEIWRWTNACYKDALVECYPAILRPRHHLGLPEIKEFLTDMGIHPGDNPQVNDVYLSRLKMLSTKQINLIIEADNKQVVRRAAATIDALMNELFERATENKDE